MWHGMDPDEVDGLARRINSEASNLQSVMTKLDGLVSSMQTNWSGTDSTRFHDTYQSQYRGQIANAIQHLNSLATTAMNNANEQRATSA